MSQISEETEEIKLTIWEKMIAIGKNQPIIIELKKMGLQMTKGALLGLISYLDKIDGDSLV